ncbi:MAG TPA: tRNA pseudouridine(38-40) synthase TruA [Chloroflexia bacterium]|nr:tRNA pseudouridine(38-40) synthase TruA [Chloroflexia bacterium]
MHLKLRIQYDGTDFVGSQLQKQGRTVQGELEAALSRLAGEPVRVALAGRTDSGVHAWGQVASLDFPDKPRLGTPGGLQRALNAILPGDVAVTGADIALDTFHARFSARRRAYRYLIWNAPYPLPLYSRYSLHIRNKLDWEAMAQAAKKLVGTHDFAAFAGSGMGVRDNESTESKPSTVRTMHIARFIPVTSTADYRHSLAPEAQDVEVWDTLGSGMWALDLVANAFLPQMVRAITGTLLEVGQGRRTVENMSDVIESRDRSAAGQTAKAHGLCLLWVEY